MPFSKLMLPQQAPRTHFADSHQSPPVMGQRRRFRSLTDPAVWLQGSPQNKDVVELPQHQPDCLARTLSVDRPSVVKQHLCHSDGV